MMAAEKGARNSGETPLHGLKSMQTDGNPSIEINGRGRGVSSDLDDVKM